MGFDVTYHPINEDEIQEWYFDRLKDVKADNLTPVLELAKSFGTDDFYIDKYITTLRVGVTSLDNGNESFDKTHGFYIAVVQGFFRTYFYTRGSALSFLIDSNPEFQRYTKSWQDILHAGISCPIQNKIFENYCSGVYLPYEQVKRLHEDYENVPLIKEQVDLLFSHGRINVFLKAVTFCLDNHLGMLEATEVAEPNPMALNESQSFSDFFNHCDKDGPYLYQEAALMQIKEALDKSTKISSEQGKKKGFFSKLFNK